MNINAYEEEMEYWNGIIGKEVHYSVLKDRTSAARKRGIAVSLATRTQGIKNFDNCVVLSFSLHSWNEPAWLEAESQRKKNA